MLTAWQTAGMDSPCQVEMGDMKDFLFSDPVFEPHAPAAGNETLQAKPVLVYADGAVNPDYFSELSDYLADHTAFRAELITARAHAAAALFGESSSDQVILGKDGWLFYARELPDYEGSEPMSDRQIWCAARSLYLMQEYASAHAYARDLLRPARHRGALAAAGARQRRMGHPRRGGRVLCARLHDSGLL